MRNRLSLRTNAVLAVGAASLALGFVAQGEREARACGGCFHPPTQTTSDITDERMLLSVSQTQTTLYDQIRYSGTPSSFAWVLPIHGAVTVGLSADVLFDSIDAVTATQIQAPAITCPSLPESCFEGAEASNSAAGAGFAEDAGVSAVTVTSTAQVGPYETVQLHSTDANALSNWLATNGYDIPDTVKPIIAQYVTEGFDFLAMKLLPDQGVQAMRPVRVTTQGASLSLPLRMAAIGTGATVGITLWVVSDGRYEPQNFPFFHIEDSDLVWDFNLSSSNYTTLRASHEAELGGKGWEMESSLDLSQQLVSNVILNGGIYYGNGGFSGGTTTSSADGDYLPVTSSGGAEDDGGVAGDDAGGAIVESADDVRNDDIAALFAGLSGSTARITRMRSDIAHSAMTVDFKLQASTDQSELSNIRVVTNEINLSCPVYQNCAVVGTGTPAQAEASVSDPSNNMSGGCMVAPRSRAQNQRDAGIRFGALAGVVGIVAFRLRRRSKKSAR